MPLTAPVSLRAALAAETDVHHAELATLPYQRADAGELARLLDDVDRALAPARAELRRLAHGEPSGVPHLFVATLPGMPPRASLHAMLLVEVVRWCMQDDPAALPGLAVGLDVELPPAMHEPIVATAAVAAAREVYGEIQGLFETLYPPDRRPLAKLAAVINVDAGQYPVAEDLREIAAGFRAGERSWRRFPYYRWRYGDRGRRFIWSDSAWLASLVTRPRGDAWRQMEWIARLLSSRGMPTWMTEDHLRDLHNELCRAVPDRAERYEVIAQGERMLRDARRRALPESAMWRLAEEFDRTVGHELADRWPGVGALLAAAVADERLGIDVAVAQVERFFADPDRFPPEWITAVRETIRRSRLA